MTEQPRIAIIVANWKMYKTIAETEEFVAALKPLIADSNASVWIAAPFTSIKAAKEQAEGSSLRIGAQNMNDASEGAFTGEIAAKMLVDVGASFVLLGHSERRQYFQENNTFINRKIKRSLEAGLQPLLCIGETLEERNAGDTEDVLATQISECLADIETGALTNLVLAYEPVWAIGTGLSATPEMAQQAHLFCREYLTQHWGTEVANRIPLLYGGSAKPDNASALLNEPEIDGLLVGGASLQSTSFAVIVNSAPLSSSVKSISLSPDKREKENFHET